MAALEEVKTMQTQGMSENEIIQSLQQKGLKYKEISEALAQSRIKAAVGDPSSNESHPSAPDMAAQIPEEKTEQTPQTENIQENLPVTEQEPSLTTEKNKQSMQKSMLETPGELAPIQSGNNREDTAEEYVESMPEQEEEQMDEYIAAPGQPGAMEEYGAPAAGQPGAMEEYGAPAAGQPGAIEEYRAPAPGQPAAMGGEGYEYPAYENQVGSGISSDVITEISEQVVEEKLSETRKHLEKVIDFKTVIEAKTESLNERLKRMEKIIDTLQSSVLRKVGDYVTNVDDIKKELIETQKTFSKLVPKLKRKSKKTTTK